MRTRRWVAVLVLVTAVTAALVVTTSREAGAGAPLTDDQVAWLADHGPIRVGYLNQPPIALVDPDGRVSGGWGYDAMQLALLKVGASIAPVLFTDREAELAALLAGEIDIIGVAAQRPDLLESAEHATPFAWTPVVFVINDALEGIRGPEDLAGHTVSTIPGSPMEQVLRDDFPDLVFVPTSTPAEGITLVASGEIAAYLGPLGVIGYQLQLSGHRNVRPVGAAINITEAYAWGLPGSEALAIVEAGRQLITPSELRVTHVRWTGFDLGDPSSDGIPAWVWQLLVLAIGVALLFGAFALILRRRGVTATAELVQHRDHLEELVAERTDELARANAKLERSNGALSEFANIAAHDLRSPVSGIAGLASLLQRGIVPADQVNDSLDRIERSARRVAEMVGSMLDEAQVVATDAAVSSVNVDAFRDWLNDLTGPSFRGARAILTVTCEGEVIDCRPSVLMHVVRNLVDNALKYAPVDGQALAVEITATRGGEMWTIDVDDNGPGIAEELRERIFERWYQGEDVAEGLGAGLGLAECRDRAHGHLGDLVAMSAPNGGARFRLTLPIIDEDTEFTPGPAGDDQRQAANRVG